MTSMTFDFSYVKVCEFDIGLDDWGSRASGALDSSLVLTLVPRETPCPASPPVEVTTLKP